MSVAKKRRMLPSRAIERLLGSSCNLVWKFIPTFPFADLCPQLPRPGLRLRLDAVEKLLEARLDLRTVGNVVARCQRAARVEVACDRSPEPPVGATQSGNPAGVDRLAVRIADRVALEEREGVPYVLLVQLRDLQLRQKQLRQRDRDRVDLEPSIERDLVGHGEGAHEDVHLAVVLDVEEEEPLLPVQGVEGDVRLVTLVPEELGRRASPLLRRDEVEVG